MLEREEYVEQAFFFRSLRERLEEVAAMQDLLAAVREEVIATTKLPMAIDYMLAELKHSGTFSQAMQRLSHYFSRFQAYLVDEAERERGRFDLRIALDILAREADYRGGEPTVQGVFFFQFESICRNRLSYDRGLVAIAGDAIYDENWKKWIGSFRRRLGMGEVADLIFVRSEHYKALRRKKGIEEAKDEPDLPALFGEREGRIALANRKKDPIYMFQAMHRQLGYPDVPRPSPEVTTIDMIPSMARRLERLEQRVKLVEEENRGGIDITKFYEHRRRNSAGESG